MSRLKSRKTKQIEEWRVIPDYPNYEVSSLGRVRRSIYSSRCPRTFPGRILKQSIHRTGYSYVPLNINRKFIKKAVHRLVLETFVGPCPEGMECNHKNAIRNYNPLINLEWICSKKNRGKQGEKHYAFSQPKSQVDQVRWLVRLNLPASEIISITNCKRHVVFRMCPRRYYL